MAEIRRATHVHTFKIAATLVLSRTGSLRINDQQLAMHSRGCLPLEMPLVLLPATARMRCRCLTSLTAVYELTSQRYSLVHHIALRLPYTVNATL